MIGIYKITNLVNGKIYIGQSVEIEARWYQHINELDNNKHNNNHLQRAWNIDGKDNFKFEVIEQYIRSELNDKEIYWVKYYDSCKNGYNQTYGGHAHSFTEETKEKLRQANLGKHASEETKEKIRLSGIGRYQSDEKREKIRQSRLGKSSWSKGKHFTKEHVEKIRIANTGKKFPNRKGNLTPENKEKLRLSKLGIPRSAETKEKLRQASLGQIHSEKSRKLNSLKGTRDWRYRALRKTTDKDLILKIQAEIDSINEELKQIV